MDKFEATLAKIKALDIERLMLEAIELAEPEIVQVNTEQLLDGKTSKGELLPDYSPGSVFVYGKRPGPWQLKDTGAFHNSFFLLTDKFPVLFDASDNKKDLIFAKLADRGYVPEEIFGIAKENKDRVAAVVRQKFSELLMQALQV